MNRSLWNLNSVTRRGVVVAAAATAAAILIRSKPASVSPRPLDANRSFPDPSFLIRPELLQDWIRAGTQHINLLDASSLASFRNRHIPGAQGVWWQDTMELNASFYGMVLKPDNDETQGRRQQLLSHWGVQPDLPTIVYDDTDGQSACRLAWFLRFLGISAMVLDGGMAGWLAIGGTTTADATKLPAIPIASATPQPDYYFLAEQIASRVADGTWRVVDLREPDERTTGPWALFTIPGAAVMPRSLFMAPEGGIRDPESLAALLANAAINPDDPLILMGPTGMDARLPWIALRAMGASMVAIGDGGWQEWVTIPGVPLESLA